MDSDDAVSAGGSSGNSGLDHGLDACVDRVLELGRRIRSDAASEPATLESCLAELQDAFAELRILAADARCAPGMLEAEAHHYRQLFDYAPDAHIVTDSAGVIQEVNRIGETLLGSSDALLAGRPLAIAVDARDRPDFERRLAALSEAHGDRIDPWRIGIVRDGGGTTPVEVTVKPLPDGAPEMFHWHLRDVTLREQIEAALRDRQGLLDAVVETAADAVITIHERGTIERFNAAAERMFGYSRDEAIGADVSLIMCPEDGKLHQAHVDAYVATGQAKVIGSKGREVRGRRKDGTVLPIDLTVSEVRHEGHRRFTGILRDISQRKQMESELRRERDFAERLLDTAHAIVLLLDPEGRIVRFNTYMEDLSGYRLDEVRGADWFTTFLPERDRPHVSDLFADAVTGKASRGNRNPIVTKNGNEIEIEWYDTVVEDEGGHVTGLLVIGLDVSERARLEKEFLQAQKMEAVGQLAAGIAHDFNNLLMGIMGCCRAAADALSADDPALVNLREISGAVYKGSSLTRRLLSFSSKHTFELRPVDLDEVIGGLAPMLRRLVGEDVDLVVTANSDGARVLTDPSKLEQVLMNLAVNARDAMSTNGTLTIGTERVDGPEDGPREAWVELRVTDTGEGMDADTVAHAFDPFFTTKEPGRGTGLGLSTTYAIVKELGGHIDIESAKGRGTTVQVLLPRAKLGATPPTPPTPVAAAPTVAAGPPAAPPTSGTPATVLIVEDESLVRVSVRALLQQQGYTTLEAATPEQALKVCAEHGDDICLLLTDVQMPGMSGPDLVRKIRASQLEFPAVYMSAYPHDYLVGRGTLLPDDVSLEKPFSEEDLARCVREALAAAG